MLFQICAVASLNTCHCNLFCSFVVVYVVVVVVAFLNCMSQSNALQQTSKLIYLHIYIYTKLEAI